jgi:hypothetical protein
MTRVEDVDVAVEVSEGRIMMTGDGDADLYLSTPNHTPLSQGERHAMLHVSGEGFEVTFEFDESECATLAAAFDAAPEELDE